MSIQEFNVLSLPEKLYFTIEKGVYLDKHYTRFGEMQIISIYSINMFYVEIIFSIEQRKVLDVIAFKNGKNFNKYSYFLLRGI